MNPSDLSSHENGSQSIIVIVGASFSGLTALSYLSHSSNARVRVILIDPKDYFEYSPGVLVCLRTNTAASRLDRIISPLQEFYQSHQFIQGSLKSMSPTSKLIQVESVKGGIEIIRYDALLLCCGLPYPVPIRSHQPSVTSRKEELIASAENLKSCHVIGILGGGLIGVELAAELCSSDRQAASSKIIIFTSEDCLLPTLPVSAGNLAQRWLSRNGVEIIFSSKIASLTVSLTPKKTYELLTTAGHRYSVDSVMNCTGNLSLSPDCSSSNSEGDVSEKKKIHDSSDQDLELSLSSLRTKRGTIAANSSFQVKPTPSSSPYLHLPQPTQGPLLGANGVFVCGDLADICPTSSSPSPTTIVSFLPTHLPRWASQLGNNIKSGFVAEIQAEVAAENALLFCEHALNSQSPAESIDVSKRYLRYPTSKFFTPTMPLIACVTLGISPRSFPSPTLTLFDLRSHKCHPDLQQHRPRREWSRRIPL
jgi:hypothetical protein